MAAKAGCDRVKAARLTIGAKPCKLPATCLFEALVLAHQNDHILGTIHIRTALDVKVINNDSASLGEAIAGQITLQSCFIGIDVVNTVKD